MKIDVTYEKGDILRLVHEDLKRRLIKVKAGTLPEYKGALHVKLAIEAEDDEVGTTPEVPAVQATPSQGDGEAPGKKTNGEDTAADMESVLSQSRKVQATVPPTFKTDETLRRTLGPNESLEYPKE